MESKLIHNRSNLKNGGRDSVEPPHRMFQSKDWIRFIKPQGGLTSKPRVARIRATLVYSGKNDINPNGVAHYHAVVFNPVGVGLFVRVRPQGGANTRDPGL